MPDEGKKAFESIDYYKRYRDTWISVGKYYEDLRRSIEELCLEERRVGPGDTACTLQKEIFNYRTLGDAFNKCGTPKYSYAENKDAEVCVVISEKWPYQQ